VHEAVVVIDEKEIDENVDNFSDNEKVDTSVLFYNNTASCLLKTKLRTAD